MSGPEQLQGVNFEAAPDYHELNAGAHRNPPRVLTAPALVWHLAFWTCEEPDELEQRRSAVMAPDSEQALQESRVAGVKDKIDEFILALCRALQQNPGISGLQLRPSVGNARLLFNNRCGVDSFDRLPKDTAFETTRQRDVFYSTSRAVGVQFRWKKLDVAIRFEIHTEYCSISTFIELDPRHDKTPDKPKDYSDIARLNKNLVIARIFLHARRTPTGELRRDDATADMVNVYFFREFWKDFETEIFLDAMRAAPDKLFKRVFADFRGLVASEQAITFPQYSEVFRKRKRLSWGEEAKVVFLPLIQHREPNSRYECTISYLLDGRAIYMSTLGPQSSSMPDDQRSPVEFILYTQQRFSEKDRDGQGETSRTVVNKWQLGRLVSQILLLGTLRLCALKDVKLLHKAGGELAGLDEIVQRAREMIAGDEDKAKAVQTAANRKGAAPAITNGNEGFAGSGKPGEDAQDAGPADGDDQVRANIPGIQHIANAHQTLNQITRGFLDRSASGLLYRIERSRYYVKQFADNVKLLRILRVEGNQPYDQFIQRRLGSEFDFIDRLGIRYERATRNISTLDQHYLAITQNALVQRANKIDLETKGIQSEIRLIQEWGEFALLGALVPYYLMHLFALIVGEDSSIVAPLTGLFWSILVIVAFFRKFGKTRHFRAFRATIALLALIALGSAVLLVRVALPGGHSGEQDAGAVRRLLEISQQLERSAGEQIDVLRQLLETQKQMLDARGSAAKPVSPEKIAPNAIETRPPAPVETQPKAPER